MLLVLINKVAQGQLLSLRYNTTHAMQSSHIDAEHDVNHEIQTHTVTSNADEAPDKSGWIRRSAYPRPAIS